MLTVGFHQRVRQDHLTRQQPQQYCHWREKNLKEAGIPILLDTPSLHGNNLSFLSCPMEKLATINYHWLICTWLWFVRDHNFPHHYISCREYNVTNCCMAVASQSKASCFWSLHVLLSCIKFQGIKIWKYFMESYSWLLLHSHSQNFKI